MLRSLFKPKWQHRDPDVRRRAIERLDGEQDLPILLEIAQGDPVQAVRQAALERITRLETLRELSQQTRQPALSQAARQQYLALLGQLDRRTLSETLCQEGTPTLALDLATHHPDAGLRALALELLTDDNHLLQVALQAQASQTRQAAVERMTGADALRQALEQLKTRDKGAAQRARARLDAIEEAARAIRDRHEQQVALVAKLEQLAASEHLDTLHSHRLEHLAQQWAQQEGPAADLAARAAQAITATRARWQAVLNARQAAEQAQQQRAEAATQQQQIVAELTRTSQHARDELPALPEQELAILHGNLRRVQDITHAAWEDTLEHAPPEAGLLRHQQQLSTALTTLTDALEQLRQALAEHPERPLPASHLDWPTGWPRPGCLAGPAAPPPRSPAPPREDRAALQQQTDTLRQQLQGITQLLDEGHPQQASEQLRALQQRLNAAPPTVQRSLRASLRAAQARLHALRDWQQFATSPKRSALCERMETLAEQPLPPIEQAAAVRELQQAWKELGASAPGEHALWRRFQAAAERAYAPCRSHFAEQQELRQYNAEQRTLICDSLERYLSDADWQQPDWALCQQVLHTAREEWRRFHPVERRQQAALQKRFDTLCSALGDRLEAEHARNIAARQALVEQAEALAGAADIATATDTAKALQAQWRALAGPVPERAQRALWRRFRSACDAVFDQRQQARNAERGARQNAQATAEQLTTEARTLLTAPDEQAGETRERLRAIQTEWENITGAPAAQRRAFEQARAALQLHLDAIPRRQYQQRALTLLAHLAGDAPLPDALPPAQAEALARRQPDPATARDLAIRLEALAGLDSPAEDHERRMALQLARLGEHFRGGEAAEPDEDTLLLAWLRAAPAPGDTLHARVLAAWRGVCGL